MTFNYGAEKRKFEKVWAKLAKTYAEAGMEPEAIKAMYEFDWEIFKSERNEALHTQEFAIPESANEEMDDCESPLYEKFLEQLSSEYDTFGSHSRYWWLEELTTPLPDHWCPGTDRGGQRTSHPVHCGRADHPGNCTLSQSPEIDHLGKAPTHFHAVPLRGIGYFAQIDFDICLFST